MTREIIPSLHLLAVPLLIRPTAVRFKGCEVATGYSDWKHSIVLALRYVPELGTHCSGWVMQPLTKARLGHVGSLQPQCTTEGAFWGCSALCQAPAHVSEKHQARGHLTGETPPCSQRGFSQGKFCLLCIGCSNTYNFPKFRELYFIFCDNSKCCLSSPL